MLIYSLFPLHNPFVRFLVKGTDSSERTLIHLEYDKGTHDMNYHHIKNKRIVRTSFGVLGP